MTARRSARALGARPRAARDERYWQLHFAGRRPWSWTSPTAAIAESVRIVVWRRCGVHPFMRCRSKSSYLAHFRPWLAIPRIVHLNRICRYWLAGHRRPLRV